MVRRIAAGAAIHPERTATRPPRLTAGSVTLWVGSVAVLAAWAALAVGGILIVANAPNLLVTALGAAVLLVAVVSRPRLGSGPDDGLRRGDAPTLFALLDEISASLKAPRIHAIGLDGVWNAGTYRYGPLQRHALVLGLPLWHALDDDARVALLGHEIGHGVNGDTTRGIVQGTAFRTLATWAFMTEPDELFDDDQGMLGPLALPANLLLLGLTIAFVGIAEALHLVSIRSWLRAELYADRLGASLAGTEAMVATLERLRLTHAYVAAVASVAISGRPRETLLTDLGERIASTPASEIERLRRRERLEPYALDPTHPPTAERVAVLERSPQLKARVKVEPERMRAIDAELSTHAPRVLGDLIEEYLAALS